MIRSKPSMTGFTGLKGSTSGRTAIPSNHSNSKPNSRSRTSRNSNVQTSYTSSPTKTGRTTTTETYYYKYSSNGTPMPLSSATTSSSESLSEEEYLSSANSVDDVFRSLSSDEAWRTMYSWELNELKVKSSRVDAIRKQKAAMKEKMDRLGRQEEAMARLESIGGWRAKVAAETTPDSLKNQAGTDHGQDKDWYKFIRKQLRGLSSRMEELSEEEKKAEGEVRRVRDALDRIKKLEDSWITNMDPPPIPSFNPSSPPNVSPSSRPLPSMHASAQKITREYYYFSATIGGRPQANTRRHTTDGPTFRTTPPANTPPRKPRSNTMDGIKTKPPTTGPPQARRETKATYEERWTKFEERYGASPSTDGSNPISPPPLRFKSIPWPLVLQPTLPTHITRRAVESFLFPPSRATSADLDERKVIIRNAIRRYHPDKFLTKYLSKVEENEKENVKLGIEVVTRSLNEILQAENARRS
ncbi:hypothetical protein FRC02_004627 [Tulasnella sp. 418]|nr:hypothetical protein FRC02_004627 [Tulasnella sp. 418]